MSDARHQQSNDPNGDPSHSVASYAIRVLAANNDTKTSRREKLVRRVMRFAQGGERPTRASDLNAILGDRVNFEELIDAIIPDAARRFGEGWEADELSFAEVSIASARLQSMVRLAMEHIDVDYSRSSAAPLILVVVTECEQHTLGSIILSSWLTRRGVCHELIVGKQLSDVERVLSAQSFDAAFVSVATSTLLSRVEDLIKRLKRAAPDCPVVVGGPAVEFCKADLERLGADFVTSNPQHAMEYLGIGIPANPELEKI